MFSCMTGLSRFSHLHLQFMFRTENKTFGDDLCKFLIFQKLVMLLSIAERMKNDSSKIASVSKGIET